MTRLIASDPAYAERVRASFGRQSFMTTLGAELVRVEPGQCEIHLPYRADLCQQHGYIHAGVTTTLADNAAGYAAYSLMPANSAVLTVEFKVNLLAPAVGERLIARAHVRRSGKTISVVHADVFAVQGGKEKLVAVMLATMMCLPETPDP
jgi:uncharacterized protein (TIGR00369 family)